MTIYNFNLGIGWASSGVEYAQAYRSNIFKKNGQKAKFIFTDLFHENIEPMTKNIGFEDEEILSLYQSFTDVKISPTTHTLSEVEAKFSHNPGLAEKRDNRVIYHFPTQNLQIIAFIDEKSGPNRVNKTEYILEGNLIQRNYYSYVKTFSEYFKPVNHSANLYQRRFFNEDGSLAYEELLNGKQSLYIFKDRTVYSKEHLLMYFIERLNLTAKDMLIIDRSTGMGPEIIKSKGDAKVGVVIHAEHFNEPLTTAHNILWNNYYDYQFENAQSIDFFVTATQRQKEILEEQFSTYNKGKIQVYTIPVGSIDALKRNKRRPAHALVTASRLASEKHLDWMIRAVVKAQASVKDLSLDIYGRGEEEGELRKLIQELNAQDYIQLMGQHNLDQVYKKYQTYVSTSTSEGFGLTLLEAVGSGLSMIGFDVRYGNQTFIQHEKNGQLVDYIKNETDKNIQTISDAIVKTHQLSDQELEQMSQVSYSLAKPYLTKSIQKLWLELEEEMINA